MCQACGTLTLLVSTPCAAQIAACLPSLQTRLVTCVEKKNSVGMHAVQLQHASVKGGGLCLVCHNTLFSALQVRSVIVLTNNVSG